MHMSCVSTSLAPRAYTYKLPTLVSNHQPTNNHAVTPSRRKKLTTRSLRRIYVDDDQNNSDDCERATPRSQLPHHVWIREANDVTAINKVTPADACTVGNLHPGARRARGEETR